MNGLHDNRNTISGHTYINLFDVAKHSENNIEMTARQTQINLSQGKGIMMKKIRILKKLTAFVLKIQ